jgi:hypothetical protein
VQPDVFIGLRTVIAFSSGIKEATMHTHTQLQNDQISMILLLWRKGVGRIDYPGFDELGQHEVVKKVNVGG